MTALRRELDLTATQIEDWRRVAPGGHLGAARTTEHDNVRIFEVDDRPVPYELPAISNAGGATDALELRLGAWSVVIRPVHP